MAYYKKIIPYILLVLFALILCVLIVFYFSIPNVKQLNTCFTTSMHKVSFCKESPNYIELSEIPKHTIDSLLISEDASFYFHSGFDFSEIKNSIFDSLGGSKLRGASTISQQLIKNAFLSKDKTFTRKLIEAIATYQLESIFSKDEILEYYLNMIEFGENVYGIEAASWHYFSKSTSNLNLVESAYLVQLLPNPKKRNDGFFKLDIPDRALDRVKLILKKLKKYERINEQEYSLALLNLQSAPWLDSNISEFYIDSLSEDEEQLIEEESLELEMYKSY